MTQPTTGEHAAAPGWRRVLFAGPFRVLSIVAGLMVAAMMFLTFADVVGRFVFDSPIFGAFELTEMLMGLVIFAGLPLATAARENITVTLLSDALPPRLLRMQTFVMDLIGGAFTALMGWRMWLFGERLIRVGETTLELQLSKGLIAQAMAALLWVTAAVFLVQAARGAVMFVRRR